MELSDIVDFKINELFNNYKDDKSYDINSFELLISMGELIDRLSIVNLKLYKLKDDVMLNIDDHEFKAWAAVQDVKLVEERARLKKCIDAKILYMVNRFMNGDETGGFNHEVKKYGTNTN